MKQGLDPWSAREPSRSCRSRLAVERGEPSPNEGDPTVPDGALVPDAARRTSHGRVDTLARDSDDRRDAAAARPVESGPDADDEAGCSRVASSGGCQRPIRWIRRRARIWTRDYEMVRIVTLLGIFSVFAAPVHTQSVASLGALQGLLRPGAMVVVTDQMRGETTGTVIDMSASELTLAVNGGPTQRTFTQDAVYAIRRTDPLGNGTGLGALIGAVPGIALLAGCGRYEYSEEAGLCKAGAVVGLVIGIPIGALIGRAVDRALGDQEIFIGPSDLPRLASFLDPSSAPRESA